MNPNAERPARLATIGWLLFAFSLCGGRPADAVEPLSQAHAHNDYLHPRPLSDALDHGFTSVEADLFLVDGELLVAHTRAELDAERTFRTLYLEPLRQRVRAGGGQVYPGSDGPFRLLIDIKSDAGATYEEIHRQLAEYADIFTAVRDGRVEPGAVEAVISGNRPLEKMRAQDLRYAGIDGRLTDLDADHPAHLMPLISDRWGSHFRWDGRGEIDSRERDRLETFVRRAHAGGRRIRFWATPETVAAWEVLRDVGVDHINTDDLAGLERFLRGD